MKLHYSLSSLIYYRTKILDNYSDLHSNLYISAKFSNQISNQNKQFIQLFT
jgi:hypothetical protein